MSDPFTDTWKKRTVAETVQMYRDWAESYDGDLTGGGYATPGRIAGALAAHAAPDVPVLDYGCGTGLSGAALAEAGFAVIDGTDVTEEMLVMARRKDVYRHLWHCAPGDLDVAPGDYPAIVAAGVVSRGAAPPEALDLLVGALAPGGLLALSYNEVTLADPDYTGKLDTVLEGGALELVSRETGPHVAAKGMTSDVMVLRRA